MTARQIWKAVRGCFKEKSTHLPTIRIFFKNGDVLQTSNWDAWWDGGRFRFWMKNGDLLPRDISDIRILKRHCFPE